MSDYRRLIIEARADRAEAESADPRDRGWLPPVPWTGCGIPDGIDDVDLPEVVVDEARAEITRLRRVERAER